MADSSSNGWKTMGKGEIAHCKQFLLFLTVFSKYLYCRHVKTRACLGKGLLVIKRQNLTPVQFGRMCRTHFNWSSNDHLCY